MWDAVAGGKPLLKAQDRGSGVTRSRGTHEGGARRIVSGGNDGVSVFDADMGGEPLLKLDARDVLALTWYGEGDARRIVSGGEDGVSVWDVVKGGTPLLKLPGWVRSVTWYGEGDGAAHRERRRTAALVGRRQGRRAAARVRARGVRVTLTCHRAGDGWHIVSGGHDNTLHVFDAVKGGAPLRKLEGHTNGCARSRATARATSGAT